MTDNPFTMSDADLLKRYRRALAYIMTAINDATYDGGDPVGEGETEVEAILDLLDKLEAVND